MNPSYLSSAEMVDSDHAQVQAFARAHAQGSDDRTRAVALYYAVRDGFRYDPYRCSLTPQGMKASTVLAQGLGWCVPKATLLAAACRAVGIPARLGFADVRNHLSTERMRQSMKTDIFYWHGYTEIWLQGQWRKATPAFNLSLCEMFGLKPLEFDGLADSIYHPFDAAGNRHMEYVAQRGSFDDVPLQALLHDFQTHYPNWIAQLAAQAAQGAQAAAGPAGAQVAQAGDDFQADVDRETRDLQRAANAS